MWRACSTSGEVGLLLDDGGEVSDGAPRRRPGSSAPRPLEQASDSVSSARLHTCHTARSAERAPRRPDRAKRGERGVGHRPHLAEEDRRLTPRLGVGLGRSARAARGLRAGFPARERRRSDRAQYQEPGDGQGSHARTTSLRKPCRAWELEALGVVACWLHPRPRPRSRLLRHRADHAPPSGCTRILRLIPRQVRRPPVRRWLAATAAAAPRSPLLAHHDARARRGGRGVRLGNSAKSA